jgi:hypothetical protein
VFDCVCLCMGACKYAVLCVCAVVCDVSGGGGRASGGAHGARSECLKFPKLHAL